MCHRAERCSLLGEREIGDVASVHLSGSIKSACEVQFDTASVDSDAASSTSAHDAAWPLLFKSPAALQYFLGQLRRHFKDIFKARLSFPVFIDSCCADRHSHGLEPRYCGCRGWMAVSHKRALGARSAERVGLQRDVVAIL